MTPKVMRSGQHVREYVYVKASCRYATGSERCQVCEIFVKWDGLSCPCCGYKSRIGPRNMKFKAKLRMKQEEIQESKNEKNIMVSIQS